MSRKLKNIDNSFVPEPETEKTENTFRARAENEKLKTRFPTSEKHVLETETHVLETGKT